MANYEKFYFRLGVTLSRSPEPIASCHPERSEVSPKDLAQDKLREGASEGSQRFFACGSERQES